MNVACAGWGDQLGNPPRLCWEDLTGILIVVIMESQNILSWEGSTGAWGLLLPPAWSHGRKVSHPVSLEH